MCCSCMYVRVYVYVCMSFSNTCLYLSVCLSSVIKQRSPIQNLDMHALWRKIVKGASRWDDSISFDLKASFLSIKYQPWIIDTRSHHSLRNCQSILITRTYPSSDSPACLMPYPAPCTVNLSVPCVGARGRLASKILIPRFISWYEKKPLGFHIQEDIPPDVVSTWGGGRE